MQPQRQHVSRPARPALRALVPLMLAALLAAAAAGAQTQQNTNTRTAPPPKRPVTTTAAGQHAQPQQQQQQQAAASRWHLPFFGNRNQATNAQTAAGGNRNAAGTGATPTHSLFNNLFHRNSPSPTSAPASGAANALHVPGSQTTNAAQRRTASPTRLASLGGGPLPSGRPVQSQAFLGHPAPAGSRETQTANGSIVRTAADGSVMDVRNPATGMSIHRGPDGSRRITVDKPDGSRVVVPSRGVAYVQHPYLFQAHAFDHRTFYDRGQLSHQLYRPYTYGGATLDAYAPQHFYSPQVYQWATTRYGAPQVPAWNYVTTSAPWFTESRGYFAPEPAYTSPLFWLTDFVLATSLIAAYNAHPAAPQPTTAAVATAATPGTAGANAPQSTVPSGAPQAAASQSAASQASGLQAAAPQAAVPQTAPQPAQSQRAMAGTPAATPAPAASPEITPDVKDMVADEVKRQIKEESVEARQNAENKDPTPGEGGIVQELSQKEPHTFVVASDLDLVDSTGRRCTLSEADVVQVISGPKAASGTAEAVVLASRGGSMTCERAAQVDIALSDLQEMQNHMRETIDQGLANTRTGRSAPTATPAYAASAPAPDPTAASEIQQQQQIAALTEG